MATVPTDRVTVPIDLHGLLTSRLLEDMTRVYQGITGIANKF
jgi:hypothetical protein